MALDVQVGFHPQRPANAESPPTASFRRPPFRRDNSSNATLTQAAASSLPDSDDQNDLPAAFHDSRVGPDNTARWLASAEDTDPACTSPIEMHSAIAEEREKEEAAATIDKNPCQDLPSPDNYLKSRTPSITFDPHIRIEPGRRTAFHQAVRLAINTSSKPQSILQPPSTRSSPLTEHTLFSKASRPHLDDTEVARQDIEVLQESTKAERARTRISSPNINIATGRQVADIQASSSLTSESTASSGIPEARTPSNDNMETCVISPISPISAFPPLYPPTSLENTCAWPKPRRQAPAARSLSYNLENRSSRRQSSRQNSSGSRRSTGAGTSPATLFLSRFAKEEKIAEGDGEGQEIGEYILGKQVGFGGFSVVREAYTLEGEERVVRAVKVVRKQIPSQDEHQNDQIQAEFEHEVNLWRSLGHRHILPLIAVHVTDFATFCFTKLNTGGTLFDLVRNNRQGISQQLARRYTYQLASAIRYLHEDMHVVHRDIKLENCLIDVSLESAAKDGGNLLLCDFGLAEFVTNDEGRNSPDPYEAAADRPKPRNIGPSDTSTSIAGSLQYASPELIMSPAGFLSSVADVWAFGVILYALLVGDLPFQHGFQPRVQMMILAGEWNEEALKKADGCQGMQDQALDIVHGCLDMDSDERWDISQILKSGWLEGCQEMLEEISEQWKL